MHAARRSRLSWPPTAGSRPRPMLDVVTARPASSRISLSSVSPAPALVRPNSLASAGTGLPVATLVLAAGANLADQRPHNRLPGAAWLLEPPPQPPGQPPPCAPVRRGNADTSGRSRHSDAGRHDWTGPPQPLTAGALAPSIAPGSSVIRPLPLRRSICPGVPPPTGAPRAFAHPAPLVPAAGPTAPANSFAVAPHAVLLPEPAEPSCR